MSCAEEDQAGSIACCNMTAPAHEICTLCCVISLFSGFESGHNGLCFINTGTALPLCYTDKEEELYKCGIIGSQTCQTWDSSGSEHQSGPVSSLLPLFIACDCQ